MDGIDPFELKGLVVGRRVHVRVNAQNDSSIRVVLNVGALVVVLMVLMVRADPI